MKKILIGCIMSIGLMFANGIDNNTQGIDKNSKEKCIENCSKMNHKNESFINKKSHILEMLKSKGGSAEAILCVDKSTSMETLESCKHSHIKKNEKQKNHLEKHNSK